MKKTYFAVRDMHCKIGRSENPESRLKDIDNSPEVTKIVHVIGRDVEMEMHRRFRHLRVRRNREWFHLRDDLIEFLVGEGVSLQDLPRHKGRHIADMCQGKDVFTFAGDTMDLWDCEDMSMEIAGRVCTVGCIDAEDAWEGYKASPSMTTQCIASELCRVIFDELSVVKIAMPRVCGWGVAAGWEDDGAFLIWSKMSSGRLRRAVQGISDVAYDLCDPTFSSMAFAPIEDCEDLYSIWEAYHHARVAVQD